MAAEEVLRAEREWLSAHLRLDVSALERLMAPDYVQIDGEGRLVDKEDVLSAFRLGGRSWDEAHSDELQVRSYGNVAVVVGRWRARGTNTGLTFDYAALRRRVGSSRRTVADGQRPVDPDSANGLARR